MLRTHNRTNLGIGKLTFLVFATIIAALVYVGYNVLPFYYCYYELMSNMEQLAKMGSEFTDEEIRKKLLQKIKELEIPAEPERLQISRFDGKIRLSLPYEEVFYIRYDGKDRDLHVFKFDAVVERAY